MRIPGHSGAGASTRMGQGQHLATLHSGPAQLVHCSVHPGGVRWRGHSLYSIEVAAWPDKMRVAGAWDTDPELSGIHDVINGEDAHTVHLGQQAGDILTTELTTFPSANILVAGPPCPPFSSCGKRMALEDSRSQPFKRCVDILEELDTRARPVEGAQGHHDELMFFLLENVMGINFVSHFNQPTALETLLDELRGRLGSTWLVQFVKANAWNYGLPQNRPRIYIVGRKTKFYTEYIPRGPQHFERRVRAARLLDKLDNKAPSLTTLQEQCLKQWKRHYRTSMSNTAYLGKVAFVEGGRDPIRPDSLGKHNKHEPASHRQVSMLAGIRANDARVRIG